MSFRFCVLCITLLRFTLFTKNTSMFVSSIQTSSRSTLNSMFLVPPPSDNPSFNSNGISLALNKASEQSSNKADDHTPASFANDGNWNSNYYKYSCSHTAEVTDYPWWRVDLGKKYEINEVVILNRADCCAERLHNFIVYVTDGKENPTSINKNKSCGGMHPKATENKMTINCDHKVGQIVTILINDKSSILTLCEVGVYGEEFDICNDKYGKCNKKTSDCHKIDEGYKCSCKKGFEEDKNTKLCIDIDECKTNVHNCTSNSKCINEVGSFSCECIYGYIKKDATCVLDGADVPASEKNDASGNTQIKINSKSSVISLPVYAFVLIIVGGALSLIGIVVIIYLKYRKKKAGEEDYVGTGYDYGTQYMPQYGYEVKEQ